MVNIISIMQKYVLRLFTMAGNETESCKFKLRKESHVEFTEKSVIYKKIYGLIKETLTVS